MSNLQTIPEHVPAPIYKHVKRPQIDYLQEGCDCNEDKGNGQRDSDIRQKACFEDMKQNVRIIEDISKDWKSLIMFRSVRLKAARQKAKNTIPPIHGDEWEQYTDDIKECVTFHNEKIKEAMQRYLDHGKVRGPPRDVPPSADRWLLDWESFGVAKDGLFVLPSKGKY